MAVKFGLSVQFQCQGKFSLGIEGTGASYLFQYSLLAVINILCSNLKHFSLLHTCFSKVNVHVGSIYKIFTGKYIYVFDESYLPQTVWRYSYMSTLSDS